MLFFFGGCYPSGSILLILQSRQAVSIPMSSASGSVVIRATIGYFTTRTNKTYLFYLIFYVHYGTFASQIFTGLVSTKHSDQIHSQKMQLAELISINVNKYNRLFHSKSQGDRAERHQFDTPGWDPDPLVPAVEPGCQSTSVAKWDIFRQGMFHVNQWEFLNMP